VPAAQLKKLSSLDISSNPYSAESLTKFLSLQRSGGLKEVTISHDLSKEQDAIEAEVNATQLLIPNDLLMQQEHNGLQNSPNQQKKCKMVMHFVQVLQLCC